jgi:hypothetical protein
MAMKQMQKWAEQQQQIGCDAENMAAMFPQKVKSGDQKQ